MLSNNITDYYVVSQGKTTIPGVDDGEECELTDVRSIDKSLCHLDLVTCLFTRMKVDLY